MDFLERVRQKPPHVKTQYAFAGAGVVTLLITLVWVSTLPARFESIGAGAEGLTGEIDARTSDSSNSFSDLFNETKDQLGNAIESTKETSEAAESEESKGEIKYVPGALGSLGTTQGKIETPSSSENVASGTIRIPVVPTTPNIATSSAKNPSAPRVILIATTTSQKAE